MDDIKTQFLSVDCNEKRKGHTVAQLKEFCKKLNLKISGNKEEICKRLTDFFNDESLSNDTRKLSIKDSNSGDVKKDSEKKTQIKQKKTKKDQETEKDIVISSNVSMGAERASIIKLARDEIVKLENEIKVAKNPSILIKKRDEIKVALNDTLKSYHTKKENNQNVEELSPERINCVKIFVKILSASLLDSESVDFFAGEIERGIYDSAGSSDTSYTNKCLMIISNLNPKSSVKNLNLIKKVVSGKVEPYALGYSMTPKEIYPEKYPEVVLPKPLNLEEIPDGLFTCEFCRSKKTTYYQIQLRGADENMSSFVTCLSCKRMQRID